MLWRRHTSGGFLANGERDFVCRTVPVRIRSDPVVYAYEWRVFRVDDGQEVARARASTENYAREAAEAFVSAKRKEGEYRK